MEDAFKMPGSWTPFNSAWKMDNNFSPEDEAFLRTVLKEVEIYIEPNKVSGKFELRAAIYPDLDGCEYPASVDLAQLIESFFKAPGNAGYFLKELLSLKETIDRLVERAKTEPHN